MGKRPPLTTTTRTPTGRASRKMHVTKNAEPPYESSCPVHGCFEPFVVDFEYEMVEVLHDHLRDEHDSIEWARA